jgi:hypothetical protein
MQLTSRISAHIAKLSNLFRDRIFDYYDCKNIKQQ